MSRTALDQVGDVDTRESGAFPWSASQRMSLAAALVNRLCPDFYGINAATMASPTKSAYRSTLQPDLMTSSSYNSCEL